MNNLKIWLARFFYGRNGLDTLGYAAIALSIAVIAVNLFVGSIWLTLFGYLVTVLMLFRFLSKNLARRRRENEVFTRGFNRVKAFFKKQARRVKDIRTHRYRTCPGCGVTMRLPVKRGRNTVVCPRCGRRVKVRVWI
jgi:hypothetical protein